MGKADLHAHTCHTAWCDGNQTVEELFHFVEEQTDLDLFAITDHDNTDASRAALDIYRSGTYRFDFLPGVEVTNLAGHLLCYFPEGTIVDIPSLRPFRWTVQFAQAHGAICVVAHPVYPPWLASSIGRALDHGLRIDGIEAVNTGIGEKAQRRLETVAQGLSSRVALVGNSDAHDQVAIGAAYTEFPGASVQDYVTALRERTTRPVFVRWPDIDPSARKHTARRSMTRPGWVHNIWREIAG